MKTFEQCKLLWIISLMMLWLAPSDIYCQYFGQNKPTYKVFNYKVYQTPHFVIYHYLDNDSVLNRLASMSEAWYREHQEMFRDTFIRRNPIIFYNDHADFQQTNAVGSLMGEGTGGVTEGLKQRVILPLTPSYAQTNHVLGHELVHAFQYNLLLNGDSLKLSSVQNIPLWMTEGMAEYLSLGSVDENTAMWMRDAVINHDIPTLKQMTQNTRYFPYRYGQAFWAMIGKTYGDTAVVPLYNATARFGYKKAIKQMFGITAEDLSKKWKKALQDQYDSIMPDTVDHLSGEKILFAENAGNVNVSPSLSPDGKYVVFLSERDIFTLDLYLADAHTGKILKKLTSRINRNEIDALSYIESSGTWSPDGKFFAFVVFSKGAKKLIILDVDRRKEVDEISYPGVPAINNPAWSPDGSTIVVSGLVEGVSDLYAFNVHTRKMHRITNDAWANMEPAWSPDGRSLAFVTDRPLPGQKEKFSRSYYNLAILDTGNPSGERLLPVFPGAENLNPVFSSDGKSLYFLSNRDGYRNLYRADLQTGQIYQLTKYLTGISGITPLSPAISVAMKKGNLAYSYYNAHKYAIYSAVSGDFNEVKVNPDSLNFEAATLPPLEHESTNIVDRSLYAQEPEIRKDTGLFRTIPYKPNFRLDYISNVSAGVATSRYGTGIAGSVAAIFSDIAGDNQLYLNLALNGEIYDFGGQASFVNQKHKVDWGASVSHIPYYYGGSTISPDTLKQNGEPVPVSKLSMDIIRMFEDKMSLFAYYPLSQTRRIELGSSVAYYSYLNEEYNTYYDSKGNSVGSDRHRLSAPPGFPLEEFDAAYVFDDSQFGMTAPVLGQRYRISAEKYFGKVGQVSTTVDYRKYFYLKPFTLAFRGMNTGRWGKNSGENLFYPLYLGYPWYIRGYDYSTIYASNPSQTNYVGNLFGTNITVVNLELRMPFTGPKRLAFINSKYFLSNLNFFADGGLAMSRGYTLGHDWFNPGPSDRVPVFSVGTSLRINVFGYAVLEPFYAIPVTQRFSIKNGSFGLNFFPGW